jgi:hypothetical protein
MVSSGWRIATRVKISVVSLSEMFERDYQAWHPIVVEHL